jgi:hypothetical protein
MNTSVIFNDTTYYLEINPDTKTVNSITINNIRHILLYIAIFLTIVTLGLFFYDFIFDLKDTFSGIGMVMQSKDLYDVNLIKGSYTMRGFTKSNIIRSLLKYIVLILTIVLYYFALYNPVRLNEDEKQNLIDNPDFKNILDIEINRILQFHSRL